MTKRVYKKFKRRDRDCYDTPPEAVQPLLAHLPPTFTYWEPCAGAGALIEALTGGNCVAALDLVPRNPALLISEGDAQTAFCPREAEYIITNPPWKRPTLHRMIEHFSAMRPTWLLFDADWMHTKQATPYLRYCTKIVSVGRLSWMGNGVRGFDNCAWYLFDPKSCEQTRFFGGGGGDLHQDHNAAKGAVGG